MLSTASFNALLKTLEEPPPHVKFIFATTEIRKVPVTILSRCQRFDLRRVEPDVLKTHLAGVCAQEGALVEDEGLALISRAAEGSVRDALSLLDQAIVQSDRGQITPASVVRDMLGLADRAATIGLFETVMKGDTADALARFRQLYGFGADPVVVIGDLLEHTHAAAVAKTLGPAALALPSDQAGRLAAIGAEASAGILSRMWQMLLRANDEIRRAPDPMAAAEMALIRVTYAAELPGPEEALKRLQSGEGVTAGGSGTPSGGGGGGGVRASAGGGRAGTLAAVPQPTARALINTFQDVVQLIDEKRDITLKLDVERFVRLVDFKPGLITFEPAPGAPPTLTQRLTSRLREWTGDRWMAEIRGGGTETAYERERREEKAERAQLEEDPFVKAVLETFPGAEIVAYRKRTPSPATAIPDSGADDDDDGEGDTP
jgi:DNA polymerase-3 subunit gamma/tau